MVSGNPMVFELLSSSYGLPKPNFWARGSRIWGFQIQIPDIGNGNGGVTTPAPALAIFLLLKEMAEKVPEAHISSKKSVSVARNALGYSSSNSNGNMMSVMSPRSESNINSSDTFFSKGKKSQNEKAEWMVQDEPGVYITLASLPGGHNELRRVRFSRKRFTEEEAEKWWAEHGASVCERHNIQTE